MSGDNDVPDEKQAVEQQATEGESSEDVSEDDLELNTEDDMLGGSTAEINVDELVAKIDAEDTDEAARKRELREKLDALNEQGDDKFGSTYNFNIDEDL